MKIAIFGSTGGVGRHLVPQALEAGHEVTAFTRSPGKVKEVSEALRVVEGDVLDPAAVAGAVEGQDAVLCALGMPLRNKEFLRSRGTREIIRAMKGAGVRRLVCLSALGTGESNALLPFHYRYFLVPLFMADLFADHELQESYVRESGFDWVIARPGNFTNGKRTGAYRHGISARDPRLKLKIARADVAEFLLRQLTDDTYLHQAAALSY